VREALCELELPYRCLSAGKGSPRREQLRAESGRTTVPFLRDPNTGASVSDSDNIVRYLFSTYGAAS
jgi:glutathione S-transferase